MKYLVLLYLFSMMSWANQNVICTSSVTSSQALAQFKIKNFSLISRPDADHYHTVYLLGGGLERIVDLDDQTELSFQNGCDESYQVTVAAQSLNDFLSYQSPSFQAKMLYWSVWDEVDKSEGKQTDFECHWE